MNTNPTRTTGRYTRNCPTIAAATRWYNDGTHMSHTTRNCPAYGIARPVTTRNMWDRSTVTTTPTAWVCARCTDTTVTFDDTVPARGSARCHGCDMWLPVTRFPTTAMAGVGQVRDDRVCRACHKLGVHVDGELGYDPAELPGWLLVRDAMMVTAYRHGAATPEIARRARRAA